MTGDSKNIDELLTKVQGLVKPLDNLAFDIFDREFKGSWDAVMNQFREKVLLIEQDTKVFIDSAFRKLRSALGAFDLLQNFQSIKSRDSINKQVTTPLHSKETERDGDGEFGRAPEHHVLLLNLFIVATACNPLTTRLLLLLPFAPTPFLQQMMEKFDDILFQYSKEVEQVGQLFIKDQWRPELYKNYPPVAGAIAWAISLYHRVKKPIIKFRTMDGLLKSEHGEKVKEQYLVVARSIDYYVKELFERWHRLVGHTCTDCLKLSVLGPYVKRRRDGREFNPFRVYRCTCMLRAFCSIKAQARSPRSSRPPSFSLRLLLLSSATNPVFVFASASIGIAHRSTGPTSGCHPLPSLSTFPQS